MHVALSASRATTIEPLPDSSTKEAASELVFSSLPLCCRFLTLRQGSARPCSIFRIFTFVAHVPPGDKCIAARHLCPSGQRYPGCGVPRPDTVSHDALMLLTSHAQAKGWARLHMGNITVTDVAPNGASAPLVRITGGTPFWLGGFHVDGDLRRRVSCWRPVWVGGICQASPGM